LKSLSEQLLLQVIDLLSEVWNLGSLRLDDSKLTFVVSNLELKKSDIFKSLSVLDFTSGQGTLQDLDLFVEQSQLIISSDKLSSKDISLIDDVLEVFFESIDLILGFLHNVIQFLNLIGLLTSQFFTFSVFLFTSLNVALELLDHAEAVRSDRNLYSKNLIEAQDEVAELKRKFKIASHQISQLKDEIDTKELALGAEILIKANNESMIKKLKSDIKASEEKYRKCEELRGQQSNEI
jgi:hypothetical protein